MFHKLKPHFMAVGIRTIKELRHSDTYGGKHNDSLIEIKRTAERVIRTSEDQKEFFNFLDTLISKPVDERNAYLDRVIKRMSETLKEEEARMLKTGNPRNTI